jgi:hypothetical protein
MTVRLLVRPALRLACTFACLGPALCGSAPARTAPATQTYFSATNRYTVLYPAGWVLDTHGPVSFNAPHPKLPKTAVTFSTPGRTTASNLEAALAVLVSHAHFTDAELHRLADSLLSENDILAGTMRRSTREINGVAFYQIGAIAKSGPLRAALLVLSTLHGGTAYILLSVTVLHRPSTAKAQRDMTAIINSIRLL